VNSSLRRRNQTSAGDGDRNGNQRLLHAAEKIRFERLVTGHDF